MDEITERFLAAIDDCLANITLNQNQLSESLNFSNAYISLLRGGQTRTVKAQDIKIFCDKYEYSILWVMTGKGEMRDSNEAKNILELIKEIKKGQDKMLDIQGNMLETLLNQLLQPTIKPDPVKELTQNIKKSN
jgi:DNA-binding Xre family transcriptional regulator